MECYIEYLDCKNRFKRTKKEFKTYKKAKDWAIKNLENFNSDFIKFN